MQLLNRLLALQVLAILVALVGEFAASGMLVTAGVVTFFVALVAMFAQMTAALITGLSRSDGRARVH